MNTTKHFELRQEIYLSFWHYGMLLALLTTILVSASLIGKAQTPKTNNAQITYNTVKIDGLDIFYREAGDKRK